MADGQIDTSIYKDAVAENPLDMAGKVIDYRNKLLTNQINDQAVQANQMKLATERFGLINNAASSLLSDPDLGNKDITPKLWDVLGRLTKGDAMTAQHAVQFMQELPTDPARQRQAIQNVHSQTLDAWQKGKAYLGETQGVDTGGGTKFIRAPAFGGNSPPQDLGYIPNTLQPGEKIPQGDPSQPNYGAKNFVGGTGNPAIQPPPGYPQAPQATAPQQPLRGIVASSLRRQAPPMPQSAPPNPVAQRVGAPVMSDLPAGTEATFKGAADALVAARDAAATYGQRVNPLRQALPIINGMSEKDIGPTSEKWNQIKSTVQTLGGGKLLGIDPDKIADFNELKKYLNQYSSQAAAALGPRTNEGLAAAVTSNPNVNMDKLSLADLTKTAFGVERARQAGVLEFEDALRRKEVVPGQFGTFMAHWGTEADPRGFVYDLLDGKAQKKMLEGLSDVQKDRIRNAITIGKKYGLVGDVRAQ
jgi:hypothetical protein